MDLNVAAEAKRPVKIYEDEQARLKTQMEAD